MLNRFRRFWRVARPSQAVENKQSTLNPGNELLLQDRRTVTRHFFPLSATVRYGVAETEERVGIYNFSEKGLCFRGGVRFPVGAVVEITTTLPQKPLFGGRKVLYLANIKRVIMERGEFVMGAAIYRCQTLPSSEALPEPIRADKPHTIKQLQGNIENAARRSAHFPAEFRCSPQAAGRKPENRQFSRYGCGTLVQFRMPDSGAIISGELANLSLGGCFVHTPEPCPLGASVEIVVQAGKARLYTQGRVKAVQESQGMGVEFEGDLPQHLQRLPRFVELLGCGQHNYQNN